MADMILVTVRFYIMLSCSHWGCFSVNHLFDDEKQELPKPPAGQVYHVF